MNEVNIFLIEYCRGTVGCPEYPRPDRVDLMGGFRWLDTMGEKVKIKL
jgi:hypothetical protein